MNNFLKDFSIRSLVDLLNTRAQLSPSKIAYTFLTDGDNQEDIYTFEKLDQRARAIGQELLNQGLSGERILLLYNPGMGFLEGFFGCLYAGAVAVPAYPPRKNRSSERINSIIDDADAKGVLTEESIAVNLKKRFQDDQKFIDLKWIVSTDVPDELAQQWKKPLISENTLAFLQYTSGSTGVPKGVMVTHENILDNEKLIKASFSHSDATVFVGWLPLYHDMGLIGNVLQPLFLGIHCVLMSPVAFLQKPLRWLKAISKYKGTTAGAPNFAYELCTNKITDEQLEGIDLSSWDLTYNGSEPIRVDTLENFYEKFKKAGFKKESFYPCYGMAEVTLLATGGDKSSAPIYKYVDKEEIKINKIIDRNKEDDQALGLVSCGHSWLDLKVIIVDPKTKLQLQEDAVGEIWISGKSVAKGYWGKPELTEEIFHAFLSDTNEGPFLRTGDLGFTSENNLFITGRIKDLIIIRGKNLYPHDIEYATECAHSAIRPGSSAAFSITNENEERLIIVSEIDHQHQHHVDLSEVEGDVRKAIVSDYDVNPHDIVFIRQLTLPKTSSGKIQRLGTKKLYLNQALEQVSTPSLKKESSLL